MKTAKPITPTTTQAPAIKLDETNTYDEDDEAIDYNEDDDYDDEYSEQHNNLPNNLEQKSNKPSNLIEVSTEKHGDVTIKTDGKIKVFSQQSPTQKQTVVVATDRPFKLTQTQNGKTFSYPPKFESPDDTQDSSEVPDGFNKLKRKKEERSEIPQIKYSTRYLPSKTESVNNVVKPESYIKITNTLTSSINDKNNNDQDKFNYNTKSSNCENVTISCNIVYGPNGRTKNCRPQKNTRKC